MKRWEIRILKENLISAKNEISEEIAKEKEKKQLQMTDFFVMKKNKLKLKMLFLLINCSWPLLVPR